MTAATANATMFRQALSDAESCWILGTLPQFSKLVYEKCLRQVLADARRNHRYPLDDEAYVKLYAAWEKSTP
jgi:hypothetical protein